MRRRTAILLAVLLSAAELGAQACRAPTQGTLSGRIYGMTWLPRTIPVRGALDSARVLITLERRSASVRRVDTLRTLTDGNGDFELEVDSLTVPMRIFVEDPRIRGGREKIASLSSAEDLRAACFDLKAMHRPLTLSSRTKDLIRSGAAVRTRAK